MSFHSTTTVIVNHATAAGEARRVAARLADDHGFSELTKAELSLVVTEAARNAWLHGKGGEVLLLPMRSGTGQGFVDVLVIDHGPGISDIATCLRDGHSTTGTSGTGLGAISRKSGEFDIYSAPHKGTVVFSRIFDGPPGKFVSRLGTVSTPKPGERECGDAWALHEEGAHRWLMVADGLGHGPDAREAAVDAVSIFCKHATQGLTRLLQRMHDSLRKTRGAAVAVAEIDLLARRLHYAGIGNIQGAVFAGPAVQRLVSHPGTVGHVMGRVHEFHYDFPAGATLVMNSDGIGTRWDLDAYAGAFHKHPAIAAALIYRDHRRGRDDATVVVYREQ